MQHLETNSKDAWVGVSLWFGANGRAAPHLAVFSCLKSRHGLQIEDPMANLC